MLDLDALCAKTFAVTVGGRTLGVRVPSVGTVRRLLALDGCPDGELLDRVQRLAAEVLSNNEEGECVHARSLENLTPAALEAILRRAVAAASEAANEPD